MDKDTANNYTLILIITFFIAIYIICLLYLFKKKSEISSIILLIIYQTMMMFYLLHKASSSNFITEKLKAIVWIATLIGSILNFVSLLLLIMTYQHLYNEYNLDGNKTIPLSKSNEKKIKQFKTFLLVSIVLMLVLIMINAFDFISISVGGYFGKILVFGLFGLIASMLSMSSYNVYIANDLLKLKNKKVISR
jgi:hypothetical protein